MQKKLKIKLISKINKRKLKWYFSKIDIQHGITILYVKNILITIFKLILLIGFLLAFYVSIGAVEFSLKGIIFNVISFPENSFEAKEIVITQISVTLIVTSIITLVASADNKYILGLPAIEYFFPKRWISSFILVFILLFTSMFLNIIFIFKNYEDIYILSNFILSILCIAYVSYRFANMYISTNKIKSKLLIRYYKGNLHHIKKAKPLETNQNKELEALKNVTLMHITKNEISYLENIEIYFKLLKITLNNHFKLVQEYYTESINHSDLIAHIREFSIELYKQGKFLESIKLYNRLLDVLNYYKLIIIEFIHLEINDFAQHIKNIETETDARDWHSVFWQVLSSSYLQIYYYSIADLSYCRLAQLNLIYYFPSNHNLADYYIAIYENQHLIDIEKARIYEMLYDSIRMSEHYFKYPNKTIDDNKKYHALPSTQDVPVWILAEPTALLFIRIVEHNDAENLARFLHMNLSSKMMYSIRSLCLLSIIEMLSRNNKRIFYLDIKITPSKVKKMVLDSKLIPRNFNYEELIEIYDYVLEHYTYVSGEDKYVKGSFYNFSPMFMFGKSVVDTYFYQLLDGTDKQKEFYDRLNNIRIDTKVQHIISSLYNKNNKS